MRRSRTLAASLLTLLACACTPAAGVAAAGASPPATSKPGAPKQPKPGFGAPFRIAAPAQNDVIPSLLAYSGTGQAAAAFGIYDEDAAGDSAARLSLAGAAGSFGPVRTLARTQQVLSLAYHGEDLYVMSGTSPHKMLFGKLLACCSSVSVTRYTAKGKASGSHVIVPKLNGATEGVLVPVDGRLLAAVLTEEGVWAAQNDTGGHFGKTNVLASGTFDEALDAAGLANGNSVVAFVARASQFVNPVAIVTAEGTPGAAPATPGVAVTVPATHSIDEVAVAGHGNVPTVTWVETWTDSQSVGHSRVFAEDLTGAHRPYPVSPATTLASGLALAGAPNGDQVLAYRSCTIAGECTIQAAVRGRGRFGAPKTLGAIDATQTPAVAEGPKGTPAVAWDTPEGNVDAAVGSNPGALGRSVAVSSKGYAADVALAFSPAGDRVLTAWTQGQLNEEVEGAVDTIPVVAPKPTTKIVGKGKHRHKVTVPPPVPEPYAANPPGVAPP